MKRKRIILITSLGILMLVIISIFCIYYIKSQTVNQNNTNIDDKINKKEVNKNKNSDVDDREKVELEEKFKKLLEINKDTIGYIYIPGTQLDEPIVQTTDNSTYLVKTFEGDSVPFLGAVFMDYENDKKFSDPLTWLFGHARGSKVDDHRMFNDVNFFTSQEYMDTHPYVVIETPYRKHYYTIEFLVRVPETTDLYRLKFNDIADFNDHIKKAASQAMVVAKDAKLTGTSNYIVLSTCCEEREDIRTNLYCREVSDYELKDFLAKNRNKLNYVKTR